MANHKLMSQLTASDATPEEIEELYYDLKYIFDNPFDVLITAAVDRGCNYIENQDQAVQ